MSEIKKQAAKRYAVDRLSFDEIVGILGYEQAKIVSYYKILQRRLSWRD